MFLKGLYIYDVILIWVILDPPLPPVIMSSFDITHPSANQGESMADCGHLHLEPSFLILIPSVFGHGLKKNMPSPVPHDRTPSSPCHLSSVNYNQSVLIQKIELSSF